MFAGIFYGGMYGGSTTSILLNTPGESARSITAIEGNKMARPAAPPRRWRPRRSGRSWPARSAPRCWRRSRAVDLAVRGSLGAPSYFAMMLFALIAVTAVLRSSELRGAIALFLGLAIGLVGIDSLTGRPARHVRLPLLSDGIDIVVVAVAIFALGEALWVAAHRVAGRGRDHPGGPAVDERGDSRRSWKPWLRGTAYGFPFGALPAGGAEMPTFLSYITEKKLYQAPEEFGPARSRASPARRRRTTPRPPARLRCSPSACRPPPRRR